jgi:hypothetical protein
MSEKIVTIHDENDDYVDENNSFCCGKEDHEHSFKEVLLKKGVLKQKFHEFTKNEHANENLEFYDDAFTWSSSGNADKKMSTAIYEKYISADAPKQINIEHNLRMKITNTLSAPVIPIGVFEEAMNVTYKLLEENIYPRYLMYGRCSNITPYQGRLRYALALFGVILAAVPFILIFVINPSMWYLGVVTFIGWFIMSLFLYNGWFRLCSFLYWNNKAMPLSEKDSCIPSFYNFIIYPDINNKHWIASLKKKHNIILLLTFFTSLILTGISVAVLYILSL